MELFEDEEQTKLDFHIGDRGKLFAPDPSPQLDWMPHLSLDDPQFEDKIVQIIVSNTNRITSSDFLTQPWPSYASALVFMIRECLNETLTLK